MPLTINDIPLPISAELEAFAYATMDPDDAWPLEPPAWPSPSSHLGQFHFAPRWAPARRMRINRIVWPTWGMSRWAYGCFLMHATQVDDLRRSATDPNTLTVNPVTIEMSVEELGQRPPDAQKRNSSTIKFDKMYMLPTRIISRVEPPGPDDPSNYGINSDGLYLLPVVDERYFLNDPGVRFDSDWDTCSTTWPELIESIGSVSPASIDYAADTVPGHRDGDPEEDGRKTSGYAVSLPHPDLSHRNATFGMYLDAVAACVGMRWAAFPSLSADPLIRDGDRDGEAAPCRYLMMTWATSLKVRELNRQSNMTVRTAGGDLHQEVL